MDENKTHIQKHYSKISEPLEINRRFHKVPGKKSDIQWIQDTECPQGFSTANLEAFKHNGTSSKQ